MKSLLRGWLHVAYPWIQLAGLAACGGGRYEIVTPPEFSYNGSNPFPAVAGEAIALTPAVSGTVDDYVVSPPLPPSLSLNGRTGVVSGIPTAIATQRTFTITATNRGGSTSFPLVLSVSAPSSGLSYGSLAQVMVGATITPLNPSVTGVANHYAVSPTLPPGLVLDSTSGIVSGAPRAARVLTPYTITASSFAGSTSFVLLLTVTPSRS